VKVESCPSEVFIHPSVTRCWDMVRDRLNEEILKQKRLGRLNLPPFQLKGSLDGFEMFGFSSPEIIKGIEAIDPQRVCTEYWKSKPQTYDVHPSLHRNFTDPKLGTKKPFHNQPANMPDEVVLKGLFKKANPGELHSLRNVLSGDKPTLDHGSITRLLDKEIQGRTN
ncbi:lysine-specific demethylase JMJ18, partial [Thalictrum thalictroides]